MNRLLVSTLFTLLVSGCIQTPSPATSLKPLEGNQGLVMWQDEYVFKPPSSPWKLLELDEEDFSIAFFLGCNNSAPGNYPCESTFAYSEEPFGYSQDLQRRQKEFFRRFLWAARVDFEEPILQPVRALGENALQVETVGHERVLGHKVLVRAIFAWREERVVAFYFTQWRSDDRDFDRLQLNDFDQFVSSFEFRRPSFYQQLSSKNQE